MKFTLQYLYFWIQKLTGCYLENTNIKYFSIQYKVYFTIKGMYLDLHFILYAWITMNM